MSLDVAVRVAGRDWEPVRAVLVSYDVTIEAAVEADVDVWTAGTSWGSRGRIRQLH